MLFGLQSLWLSARTLFWHEGSSERDSTCLKCRLALANLSGALCHIYINLLNRRNRGSSVSVMTRPLAERRSSPRWIPGRVKKFFSKQCICHCFILPPLPEGREGIEWETSKPFFPCSNGSFCQFLQFFLFFFLFSLLSSFLVLFRLPRALNVSEWSSIY